MPNQDRRKLQNVEIFERSSNACKNDCIDKGKNFCPYEDFKGGICCPAGSEYCTSTKSLIGFCSNDSPDAPPSFKYYTCPNESACRERIISPNRSTVVLRVTERQPNTSQKFRNGDICSYKVVGPDDMQSNDKLYIKISDVKYADIWASSVLEKNGFVNEQRDVQAPTGRTTQFSVDRGNVVYITARSTDSSSNGYFRIESWTKMEEIQSNQMIVKEREVTPLGPETMNIKDALVEYAVIPINKNARLSQQERIQKDIEAQELQQFVLMVSGLAVLGLIFMIVALAIYFNYRKKNKKQELPSESAPQKVDMAGNETERRQAVDKNAQVEVLNTQDKDDSFEFPYVPNLQRR